MDPQPPRRSGCSDPISSTPPEGGSRVEVYQIWCQPARISNVKRGIDLNKTLLCRTTHRCYKLVAPAHLTLQRRSPGSVSIPRVSRVPEFCWRFRRCQVDPNCNKTSQSERDPAPTGPNQWVRLNLRHLRRSEMLHVSEFCTGSAVSELPVFAPSVVLSDRPSSLLGLG